MPVRRTTLCRLAAVALLLLAAAQLFGCALGCELNDDDAPGHCLCCCRHVAVPAPAPPALAEVIDIVPPVLVPHSPVSPHQSVYHPPKG